MTADPKRVTGLLQAVALGVALIILVSVPSGYFALAYFGQEGATAMAENSLRPILLNTAAALGLSSALALLAYLSIRVFPLRILMRTLSELDVAQGESGFQMREKQLAYEELQRQHKLVEQTAQELGRARDDAVLANRTKSEFLTHMSHELRTPLNAIIGFSQILKDELFGDVGNPRYREYGKDIYESGNHLLNVINDILDLSKVEAGKLELRREDIDVPRLLAACLRLVRERARDASVKLVDATAAEAILVLAADETRIKQIVINLLSNAIKFTPAGGTVTVTARRPEEGTVEISVADTGIGMEPGDIPIAMQPFRQIENPMNRKYEGTGIGLPLTKALVEAHGGRITVQSAAGVGTTVTVVLPAGVEPQARFAALTDQAA